jgi:hypothetical protein
MACVMFDESARLEFMIEQLIHKMHLIVSMHKSLLENVKQAQNKQRKVYVTHKGL